MSSNYTDQSANGNLDSSLHDQTMQSTSTQNLVSQDIRRGFMGSNSRLNNMMNQSHNFGSNSGLQTNYSVVSDDNQESIAVLWGTNFDVKKVESKIRSFIIEFGQSPDLSLEMELEEQRMGRSLYLRKLDQVRETEQYFVTVDATHVFEFDKNLYFQLIYYPAETIVYFDHILNDIYKENILEGEDEKDSFENSILTRVTNLKHKARLRDLGPTDINHLISIQGIIIRTSDIYPEMKDAFFRCCNCKYNVQAKIDRGRVQEPSVCEKCGTRYSFELVHNLCIFTDKQFVKMQETPDTIPEGETPQNVNLIVYDDIVDNCRPGDKVEITGIYRAQGLRASRNKRTLKSVFKTYIDVVNISSTHKQKFYMEEEEQTQEAENGEQITFSEEEVAHYKEIANRDDVYQLLVDSLAPSIWENSEVKKGILCQLFGGAPKDFSKNMRNKFRSDINILLVGDPSTAKSQLLQFVHKIAPRGIYTSGKGSSAVGLTAYVTKDPETSEVILESGALVLSDKGICCIDEFDKMDDNTKTILHEAMEQQTISIAKSGIVCSLNARTAILAAANPKESRYNPRKSIVYNIKLPPTLLSRFDLIYLMLDKANETQDTKLAQHILSLYRPSGPERHKSRVILERAEFTKYISYARRNCKPNIPDEVVDDIVDGYVQMRKMGSGKNVITATPRQLESIIRISEALAKMKLKDFVTREDVEEAQRLIKVATQQAAINPITGQIDMDLIQTGYTSGVRQKISVVADVLRDLVKTLEERFKQGIRGHALMKEVMQKVEGRFESLQQSELNEALKPLEEEKLIRVYGNRNKDKYTVKLYDGTGN